jgi:dimethylamine/trimethylamine dehydrogenase
MLELGIEVVVNTCVAAFDGASVALECIYSAATRAQPANALVLVTSREPDDALYRELVSDIDERNCTIHRIGDCLQPALIAHAVYSGHKVARELDANPDVHAPQRDRTVI